MRNTSSSCNAQLDTGNRDNRLLLVLFALIYISPDTLLFGTNRKAIMQGAGQYIVLVFACTFLFYLLVRNKHISLEKLWSSLILVTTLWLSCLVNGEKFNNYIYKTFLIICAATFTNIYNRETFIDKYQNIIFVIAAFSNIVYGFYLFFPEILNRLPTIYNTKDIAFKFGFLVIMPLRIFGQIPRSMGIFREPGVFSIFLVFALYFELLERETISIFRILVLLIALFLTYSTTGYIVIILIMTVLPFNGADSRRLKRKRNIITFAFFSIVILLLHYTDLLSKNGFIFGKFMQGSATYVSTGARIASVAANLDIFLRHQLFGAGSYGLDAEFYDVSIKYVSLLTTKNNTNTFLINFAAHGLIYGATLTFLWYQFFKSTNGSIISILLFVSFIALFSGEAMVNNVFFYIIAFYGAERCRIYDCACVTVGDNFPKFATV